MDEDLYILPRIQRGRNSAAFEALHLGTIVAGQVTFRDGEHSGALPGRLVRWPRGV